ncbi:hypothetical protein CgunFtcFv8_015117 [Champsocephalus gunnari]|uniref:Uncharacterized protein n=1 Tax=Champsocephalus gunnari TaxID=52237 RepID=A0AAN8E6R2_CHAGU|nr:hypothetical protein CgunFtcFv8_015117 [Champsocephalus gunnari]
MRVQQQFQLFMVRMVKMQLLEQRSRAMRKVRVIDVSPGESKDTAQELALYVMTPSLLERVTETWILRLKLKPGPGEFSHRVASGSLIQDVSMVTLCTLMYCVFVLLYLLGSLNTSPCVLQRGDVTGRKPTGSQSCLHE